MLILLACSPDPVGEGVFDTGVESIPVDTSLSTDETGEPAETGDSDDGCGEIAADEAGWASLYDESVVHHFAFTLSAEAREELSADPQGYAPATVEIDGVVMEDVGLRMRGPGESQRWDAKPSFRINLRKYDNCLPFASIDELVLDAGDDDPAMARQVVSAQVFSALGLATPRTAFATVEVDGESFGLYTHVESVDSHFLDHHGYEPGGTLWEGKDGADFSGAGVDRWDDVGGGGDPALIEALSTAVATAGDDFYSVVGEYLDVEQFLAAWSAIAAVGHHQSFPYEAGDVYVYSSLSSPKFVVIPWEIDEGWSPEFVWNGVESQLALRCVYDPTCSAALEGAVGAAAEQLRAANVEELAQAALTVSQTAALDDERKPWTSAEVLAARDSLLSTIASWPDTLEAAVR